jgi:lipopolysaccharide transport system ATP-binding protein
MPASMISVENLSKRYLVGHREQRGGQHSYTALRDVIGQELRNFGRKAGDLMRGRQVVQGDTIEEFWALKNVNFEVREGEVLGIIGRNGAGKSTLLKVLSRIIEPTGGRVTLRGRVASLLEVGTGFHPELTGRENIYLNGAILGMTRAEIRHKFDEIVAFAEVERFLDTPVKRYSSGMYVRLAFAVAAHLEPEILIVDEVLAVGDTEFQKKCLGKMGEVSRNGRTVLFVSHNLAAVAQLANRAVLLEKGSVGFDGPVSEAVSTYLSKRLEQPIYISPHDELHEAPYIARAEVATSEPNGVHQFGEGLGINVWIQHSHTMAQGHLGVQLVAQSQASATTVYAYPPDFIFGREPGRTLISFNVPALRCNVGLFSLRIWLTEEAGGRVYEIVDGVCGFEIVRHDFYHWWGPDVCAYFEDFSVEVVGVGQRTQSTDNVRRMDKSTSSRASAELKVATKI